MVPNGPQREGDHRQAGHRLSLAAYV